MFRILIAEDDPSTARLLCAIVKRAGYEPLIAADGVQALELLDHNQIDLLLCDVMMPRMDGFALTKAIRESGQHAAHFDADGQGYAAGQAHGFYRWH